MSTGRTLKRRTMTVDQAAKVLGTSPETVRKGVVAGKLPGTALEGERQLVYIIPEEAIENFLRTGRVITDEPGTPATE